jgi:GT2 family glycosyltransferase
MTQTPLVSIIVANYNGRRFLKTLFESIARQTYPKIEALLVDDCSTDDSIGLTNENYPWVKIIQNRTNLGQMTAYVVGLKEAGGDLIVLASNDVILDKECINQLVITMMSSDKIGLVGSKITSYYDPNDVQSPPARFYPSVRFPWTVIPVKSSNGFQTLDTDVVGTCLLMIRRDMLRKINFELIAPQYFTYFGEDGLSLSVKRKGYRLIIAQKALTRHFAGGALGKINLRKIKQFLVGDIAYRRANIPTWQLIPSIMFAVTLQATSHFLRSFGRHVFIAGSR